MKITASILVLLALCIISACSTSNTSSNNGIPACINKWIDTFKIQAKQNPPRSVTEYEWQGKKVYYITSPCCDQFNAVYDSECQYLGSPDGGITGKGDGKLPNFRTEAVNEKLVWKDER